MPTTITGSGGVDKHQDGSVTQADLAPNVVGNGPAFSAWNTGQGGVVSGAYTRLALPFKYFDTNGSLDTAMGRFSPNVSGIYHLDFSVSGPASNVGYLWMRANFALSSNPGSRYSSTISNLATAAISSGSALVYFNGTTDYVDFDVFQTSGVSAVLGQVNVSGFLARAA